MYTVHTGGGADLSQSGQGTTGAGLETGKRELESLSKSSSGQVPFSPPSTMPHRTHAVPSLLYVLTPIHVDHRLLQVCMQSMMDTDAGDQGIPTAAHEVNAIAEVRLSYVALHISHGPTNIKLNESLDDSQAYHGQEGCRSDAGGVEMHSPAPASELHVSWSA